MLKSPFLIEYFGLKTKQNKTVLLYWKVPKIIQSDHGRATVVTTPGYFSPSEVDRFLTGKSATIEITTSYVLLNN